jgi:hypothetical protein
MHHDHDEQRDPSEDGGLVYYLTLQHCFSDKRDHVLEYERWL